LTQKYVNLFLPHDLGQERITQQPSQHPNSSAPVYIEVKTAAACDAAFDCVWCEKGLFHNTRTDSGLARRRQPPRRLTFAAQSAALRVRKWYSTSRRFLNAVLAKPVSWSMGWPSTSTALAPHLPARVFG
jgi:hypothetical protein